MHHSFMILGSAISGVDSINGDSDSELFLYEEDCPGRGAVHSFRLPNTPVPRKRGVRGYDFV